jgi:hypothetical protein
MRTGDPSIHAFPYDYDVFLSHNSADKDAVRAIAQRLVDEGHLHPFLDEWCLVPGEPWQEGLEEALDRSSTCAVFLGSNEIGPWENEEMRAALDERTRNKSFRVIPVLLPGATPKQPGKLPRFLRRLTWVDYRKGLDDERAFHSLLAGILGQAPESFRKSERPSSQQQRTRNPLISHALPAVADYQERAELDEIRTFWNASERPGVLALVGIGGAGKTALVTRFLQELPESGIRDHRKPKRTDHRVPEAVFVWSFYDAPNVDLFVARLFEYLSGTSQPLDKASETTFQLLRFLESTKLTNVLIVLDGLEVIQEDRRTGPVFGMLRDSSMRHLLRRLSQGVDDVRVLLTTRFPIPDLFGYRDSGYRQIDADQLDADTARGLLLARGVRGTRSEIDSLIQTFGTHALTLDHLGSLLRDFFNGNPQGARELPALEGVGGTATSDYQAHRLTRIFTYYHQNLPQDEMNVLQSLCVFRLPVDVNVLANLLSEGRPETTAPQLSKVRVLEILQRLYSRRLVSMQDDGEIRRCSVHPSIRDYFYRTLAQGSSQLHDRVREHLVSLVERPRRERYPTDRVRLDLLEELIYHTLRSPDPGKADDYYVHLLGGYDHLGWRLCAFERGLRITSAFSAREILSLEKGFRWDILGPRYDHALFLFASGSPTQALNVLSRLRDAIRGDAEDDAYFGHTVTQTYCEALILLGRLPEAERIATTLAEPYYESGSETSREIREALRTSSGVIRFGSNPFARRAAARWALGKVNEALDDFTAAVRFKTFGGHFRWTGKPDADPVRDKQDLTGWVAFQYVELLIRLGRLSEAHAVLAQCYRRLTKHVEMGRSMYDLMLGHVLRAEGKCEEALTHVNAALAWAMKTGHQEVYCRAMLASARTLGARNAGTDVWVKLKEARRVADECGFGLYRIEGMLAAGRLLLAEKKLEEALVEGEAALDASAAPETAYAWGEASALHLCGEIQVAQDQPKRARPRLQQALELRRRLMDAKQSNTETLLQQIDGRG